jgi:hypothetical protein
MRVGIALPTKARNYVVSYIDRGLLWKNRRIILSLREFCGAQPLTIAAAVVTVLAVREVAVRVPHPTRRSRHSL